MPSIHPRYEYDIFISYRHNDNLPLQGSGRQAEGWVTDFVLALQKELAATIKEPLSIYFDKNPHDGLLDTHNVDKSLEGKLKCLIFIPIISQTYCDPKSFAWEHEFVAFNELAQTDELGTDIKLRNGNVASRILPIKIHELDSEDQSTIESEIGGVLRAIEFIFKTSGVNRPLRANEDHANDNLNKTFYTDQINKVANAIKQIITSIKNTNVQSPQIANNKQQTIKSFSNKKSFVVSFVFFFILALIYFIYQQQSTNDQPILSNSPALHKSIAVLPFVNMSSDPEQDYFSDGISEELIKRTSKAK